MKQVESSQSASAAAEALAGTETTSSAETTSNAESEVSWSSLGFQPRYDDVAAQKEVLGWLIAQRAKRGETILFGTGSTVEKAIAALKQRIAHEELNIRGIPTSERTKELCAAAGVIVGDESHLSELSWGFDGADSIDRHGNAIKGFGGAMKEERDLAAACRCAGRPYILIADKHKYTEDLSARVIPLEIVPAERSRVERALRDLGLQQLEPWSREPQFSRAALERGNQLFNAIFSTVDEALGTALDTVPGITSHGLFWGIATEGLIAREDTLLTVRPK